MQEVQNLLQTWYIVYSINMQFTFAVLWIGCISSMCWNEVERVRITSKSKRDLKEDFQVGA